MNTSHCRICGQSKTPDFYSAPECRECTELGDKATKAMIEANPDIAQSDLLYGRRQALNERAHHAHRNFVDPRSFGAQRGMIPIPPSNG